MLTIIITGSLKEVRLYALQNTLFDFIVINGFSSLTKTQATGDSYW